MINKQMKEAEDREETIGENIFCVTAAPLDLQREEGGPREALHEALKQAFAPVISTAYS